VLNATDGKFKYFILFHRLTHKLGVNSVSKQFLLNVHIMIIMHDYLQNYE